MNTTQKAVLVIRDDNKDPISVVITQTHIKSHIFYKLERMGVEEIASTFNGNKDFSEKIKDKTKEKEEKNSISKKNPKVSTQEEA